MKVAVVHLFVDDLDAAHTLYAEQLGLRLLSRDASALAFDAGTLVIVEQGDAEAQAEGLIGRFAGISFGVADIEAQHARLKSNGCTIAGPPERQAWGGILMHVTDPGGNVVSFVQD
jgi:predicted enzyme related to lactoylglutathione lyase